MKAKVFSVVVIVVIFGYLYFGVICQTPSFQDNGFGFSVIETVGTIGAILFSFIGILCTGFAITRWIWK